MTTIPRRLPTAADLRLRDFARRSVRSDPADPTGTCRAVLDPVPDGETWRLERLTVTCTATTDTEVRVYAGEDETDGNIVDATSRGNLDVADQAQPILLVQGETLTCVWTGADAGAIGTLRAQWAVYTTVPA